MALALVIGCVLAGILLATAMSRPATAASRDRAAARRAAFVSAHPTHAKSADITAALRREGMTYTEVRAVFQEADDKGLTPVDLWLWFERYGVRDLSLETAPESSDTPVAVGRAPRATPARPESNRETDQQPQREPRHRAAMPEVFEPGKYPGLQVPVRRRVSLRDNVSRERRGDHAAA